MAKKNSFARRPVGFRLNTNKGQNGALVIDTLNNITLGELAEGYEDTSEDVGGKVVAWLGQLIVRPEFQRSFVVDGNIRWQSDLLDSVINNRPTGVMYFGLVNNGETKKTYYNIDGQQRLMTLLSFIKGELTLPMICDDGTIKPVNFGDLNDDWQRAIKQYKPDIRLCIGTPDELLAWFEKINQPICELTGQELRNAAYNGEWCEACKRAFSKSKTTENPTASNIFVMRKDGRYSYERFSTQCKPERQEVLELALDWVSRDVYGGDIDRISRIECYMNEHRFDKSESANEVVNHYKTVIDWVYDVFFHDGEPKSWQSVRSQNWGELYSKYKNMKLTEEQKLHISKRSKEIISYGAAIYQKSEGIYEWVLRGEKDEEINTYLHLRRFSPEDKSAMYNAQGGIDPVDGKHYEMEEMHAHHIKSWRSGGDSKYDNLVWLSEETHRKLHAGDLDITAEELRKRRDELCKKNA